MSPETENDSTSSTADPIVVDRHVRTKPPSPSRRGPRWRRALLLALLAAVLVVGYGVWRALSPPPAWRAAQGRRAAPDPTASEEVESRISRRLIAARSTPPLSEDETIGRTAPGIAASPTRPPGSPGELPRATPAIAGDRSTLPSGETPAAAESAPRSSSAVEVELTLTEVNALLEARRARWASAGGSDSAAIRSVALTLEGDQLVLYALLATPAIDLLLGLPFDLTIDQGHGVARLLGARLGQLPLPGVDSLAELLQRSGDPRLAGIAAKIDLAVEGYPFEPSLQLDGERIEVLAVEPLGDRQVIVLTLAPSG